MSIIKKNIFANFVGNLWVSLMGFVFIPIYVKFLGMESWGLIGFFATLQAMFGLLDLGLSGTLNREMARLSGISGSSREMRDLVRTLEIIYWCLAAVVVIVVTLLAPFIANYWVNAETLDLETIVFAVLLMGVVIALQMPSGFYSGGLMGLQHHVLLNVINCLVSTMRGGFAVLILWLVSPTIKAYFLWQIAVSVLNFFVLRISLWNRLPSCDLLPEFKPGLLCGIWKFAAGISGISIAVVILTHLDKLILSRMLSLENLGYYMFASIVSAGLARLFSPVIYSVYPRMTQLVARNDLVELTNLYHKSCQFIASIILPLSSVIFFFSYEIVILWTQNQTMAEKTWLIISILSFGSAVNILMGMPYVLQLSFGWTKLSLAKTIIALVILVPLIFNLTASFGPIGAAIAWLVLNLGILFVEIPFMHRRILQDEMWKWYIQDVFFPFVVVFTVAAAGRLLFSGATTNFVVLISLLIVTSVAFSAGLLITPFSRARVIEFFFRLRESK